MSQFSTTSSHTRRDHKIQGSQERRAVKRKILKLMNTSDSDSSGESKMIAQ